MRSEFESHVLSWFPKKEAQKIIEEIDWDTWLEKPGLPPITADFSTNEEFLANKLADEYILFNGQSSPTNYQDYFRWFANLKAIFNQKLLDRVDEISYPIMKQIDDDLSISNEPNSEIIHLWYQTAIMSDYITAPYKEIEKYLGTNGRMKFVIPIFRALNEKNRSEALRIFDIHESFYHPICATQLRDVLDIKHPAPQVSM